MTELSPGAFAEMFPAASSSLFRLETRQRYDVPEERPLFAAWRENQPIEPAAVPWYRAWLDDVAARTRAGFEIQRVRIVESPPTAYQEYNAWAGRWNQEAGEDIRYITRHEARTAGVPDTRDWWMFDGETVVELVFRDNDQLDRLELGDW